jgi:hypothetical protein
MHEFALFSDRLGFFWWIDFQVWSRYQHSSYYRHIHVCRAVTYELDWGELSPSHQFTRPTLIPRMPPILHIFFKLMPCQSTASSALNQLLIPSNTVDSGMPSSLYIAGTSLCFDLAGVRVHPAGTIIGQWYENIGITFPVLKSF